MDPYFVNCVRFDTGKAPGLPAYNTRGKEPIKFSLQYNLPYNIIFKQYVPKHWFKSMVWSAKFRQICSVYLSMFQWYNFSCTWLWNLFNLMIAAASGRQIGEIIRYDCYIHKDTYFIHFPLLWDHFSCLISNTRNKMPSAFVMIDRQLWFC